MTVLVVENLSLAYGQHPLLDHAGFRIERGERVALLGRNGEGKSSLLRMLSGEVVPDAGDIRWIDGARVAVLQQNLPHDDTRTVKTVVASAFPETSALLAAYEDLALNGAGDEVHMNALQHIHEQLEVLDGWRLEQRIDQILQQFALDPQARLCDLSGGWQRRVLLARALVTDPDLLLLDEPTNHLDIPAISWLEDTVANYPGAVLLVSHDRAFIKRVATRILELDRGKLTSWPGNYDTYLTLKEKALEEEARHQALFDKKLAQEEVWIRQGIKARRTRNMGRVRALEALRRERGERRSLGGQASFAVEAASRSGKLVMEAEHVNFGYDAQNPIIRDLNLTLIRGDKLGLVGENGAGKSTLIKLLLGDLAPTAGSLRLGTHREVAYFDQLRAELKLDQTLLDNLAEGREYIEINGQRKHVLGYLQEFLFSPQRARSPASVLSGGERARLLLAKLFSKPANLLVLDEPTNDLDVETLELLESQIVAFPGTVLVISHDREFLDNVVSSVLYLDGSGSVVETVGGYTDWRRQGGRFVSESKPSNEVARAAKKEKEQRAQAKPVQPQQALANQTTPAKASRLSYKLKRELDVLPEEIEALEAQLEVLRAKILAADFYSQPQETIAGTLAQLADAEAQLDTQMQRWLELEALAQS